MKTDHFRIRLTEELVERCRRNPAYSLRAFASQLQIDPSTLSKILKGKRPIGRKVVLQLASRLGLPMEEMNFFLQDETDPTVETEASARISQLTMDRFAVISDWSNFAILELMAVDGFRPDPQWIAKALGLKRLEVQAAIDRLQRVGLLAVNSNGTWQDTSGGFTTSIGEDMKSSAHRRLQQQFLEKASEALNRTPLEERDHTTMTMAANRARIPEAREKIKRFRRSLAKFLAEGDVLDEVLNLNIALFPLTNLNERKNK